MSAAIVAYRLNIATRLMPFASIAGVIAATVLTAWPEFQRLQPYVGGAPLLDVLRALDLGILQAAVVGFIATAVGVRLTVRRTVGGRTGPRLVRGRSDNFGHADWLAIRDARRLFPGPDATHGGIVVGEAYRVDQDRVARAPSIRRTAAPGARAVPHRC